MDTTEQRENLNQALESNRFFENLLSNDDFIQWREKVVNVRLETLRNGAVSVDRTQDGWKERACDAIVAYQEARMTYEALFNLASETIDVAREQLAKLSEAQG